ncbi:hypothetical protein [Streptomyces pinistramenti]|uniref:hypothetical protein n=1 Tax=Streptomyces pinistramenti TaxID=2884812 RepID=UPI001D06A990|nr:hypothetical protein [Streptomyces pinistramenti]MCB5908430.1 hypothetical protein [Streptomyces pinistramenti]
MGTTRTTDERAATRTDDPSVPAEAATDVEEKTTAEPDTDAATGTADAADEKRATATAEHDEDSDLDGLDDTAAAHDDEDALDDEAPVQATAGVGFGAGAVVAAGLGLASVTGTWLGTLLAERQTLLGQIKLQSGKATDQIATVYGTPWHTTALVNGLFALLAVIIGGAVLLNRPRAAWMRAVAWGGLALGVLGILISAGMYFDLLASLPSIPKAPAGAGS